MQVKYNYRTNCLSSRVIKAIRFPCVNSQIMQRPTYRLCQIMKRQSVGYYCFTKLGICFLFSASVSHQVRRSTLSKTLIIQIATLTIVVSNLYQQPKLTIIIHNLHISFHWRQYVVSSVPYIVFKYVKRHPEDVKNLYVYKVMAVSIYSRVPWAIINSV